MVYNPNIPQPNDFQDVSQGDILGNFMQLDTTLGIDHYPPSNLTSDNGKHKQVTAVPQTSHPSTALGETKIYSYKEDPSTTNLGPIVYVRGESNAVQTPLTSIQSTSGFTATNTPFTLLDFTAIGYSSYQVICSNGNASAWGYFIGFWTGATHVVKQINASGFSCSGSVNNLQITKSSAALETVYWSLNFYTIR